MRFKDFRVTVEKRSAKTEQLTRMAQMVTLSTPRSVRPEPGAKDVFRPQHNRASRRSARRGK